MAITHIHKITKTVMAALAYGMRDKVAPLKDDIHDSIAYALRDKEGEATYFTLNAFQHCSQNTVERDFEKYSTNKGKKKSRTLNGEEVLAWHLVQSFDEQIPPHIANEVGQKLAREVFGNFACTISTHTNTDNTHNHIIICAWDRDGKKWNNCNSSYRNIRQVSDKLCEEYGLNVLYKTQDMKLIKWQDSEGKTHYFEPTDRKVELIRQRERGEITSDDVGSYRNTPSYKGVVDRELTNREVIQKDIDSLLPSAVSYEYLLEKLREIGYEIKDKKKSGEWLSHVAFKAPTQDKSTRDNKIGDGAFYTRENLTAYIEQLVNERTNYEVENVADMIQTDNSKRVNVPTDIPFISSYEYGEVDLSKLNDNFRVRMSREGTYETVERGNAERTIIRDIRKSDAELYGLYDTSTIERAIAESREAKRTKKPYISKRKEQILVQQIQESFDNLRFVERKNIYSFAQINDTVQVLWDKYNQCLNGINIATDGIDHLKYLLTLPSKAAEIESSIAENMSNQEYVNFELSVDKNLLANYKEQIEKYKLNVPEAREALQAKISDSEKRCDALKNAINAFAVDLNAYDRCINTLKRIDRESDRANEDIMRKYDAIKSAGEQAKREEENRANKQKGRNER